MTIYLQDLKLSSLVELLRYRALHQPDKLAFTFLQDGETETANLTYQELDQQVRAIAAYLQSNYHIGDELRPARGDRVLLLYPPGLEFIAAFFGCLYAGVIAVPAYPPKQNQKLTRLCSIITDAETKVALTTKSLFHEIKGNWQQDRELANLHLLATDDITEELATNWQQPEVDGDTLAYLQYTSDSTYKPKGVIVSHGNLMHNLEYIKQAFELTPETVSVSWLPSFQNMGLIDGHLQPLYTGFRGILMSAASFVKHPIHWLQAISRYQASHCGSPSFGYELCLSSKITPEQIESLDLSYWRSAYSSSEPVQTDTIERFAAKFQPAGFRANFFYPGDSLSASNIGVKTGIVESGCTKLTLSALAKSPQGKPYSKSKCKHAKVEIRQAEVIQAWLVEKLSQRLKIPSQTIDVQQPFVRYGLDSLAQMMLSTELEDWLQLNLSQTLVEDYPSIAALAEHLAVVVENSQPEPETKNMLPIFILVPNPRFNGNYGDWLPFPNNKNQFKIQQA